MSYTAVENDTVLWNEILRYFLTSIRLLLGRALLRTTYVKLEARRPNQTRYIFLSKVKDKCRGEFSGRRTQRRVFVMSWLTADILKLGLKLPTFGRSTHSCGRWRRCSRCRSSCSGRRSRSECSVLRVHMDWENTWGRQTPGEAGLLLEPLHKYILKPITLRWKQV